MHQPGILAPLPAHGRYLSLQRRAGVPDAALRQALDTLAGEADGLGLVVGLGPALVETLAGRGAVPGLRPFAVPAGAKVVLPATSLDLWLWLRGEDPAALLWRAAALLDLLGAAFEPVEQLAAFCHAGGRDLSGYEDGTENPVDDSAVATAFVRGQGPGLDGGSLLALQRWQHDLGAFAALSPQARDHAIGRRRSDNEELDDAPETAHVKRTAQESFAPEAFVLRRSMPWLDGAAGGLYFTAFATTLDAFDAQLARMCGAEDGLVDALFGFSRPLSGATCWCPPMHAGRLDLRRLQPGA